MAEQSSAEPATQRRREIADDPSSAGSTRPRREIADQAAVRAHNLAAVAQLVRARGRCSRREIGESIGLNKGTVSGLVAELISRGILEEGEHQVWGPGRPTRLVQVSTADHVSVVVEVLTQHVILSAWTLALTPIVRRTLPLHPGADAAERGLARVRAAVEQLVDELRSRQRGVAGIVVALPGLVDASTGELERSAPLGWEDVPVTAILRESAALREVPVLVERVANLATLAEARAQPRIADLICLHGAEAGVGVGVITSGRLLTGAHGRAGELLFPTLRPPRRRDADLAELLHRVTTPATGKPGPATCGPGHPDPAALPQLAEQLGVRLATLIALFDPELVVLAGSLAPLTDWLAPALDEQLRAAWHPDPAPAVALRPGTYGDDAPLVGGATRLADQVFAGVREQRGGEVG